MEDPTQHAAACELVVAGCDLLERGRTVEVADAELGLEIAVLVAELQAARETTPDAAIADDLACVAAELDRLLARLDHLLPPVTALTG